MSIGARAGWTLALATLVAVLYVLAVFAGLAPVPRSPRSLAGAHRVGHGYAIVSGYYVVAPNFVSIGSALPPYTLAGNPSDAATAAYVSPSLADVRSGRIAVLVDLSTGDGSKWSPYYVRTIGSAGIVTTALLVGIVVLLALLFWIAGFVASALGRNPRAVRARRAAI